MRCPYCNKEMKVGYIYSAKNDLAWTPEGEKHSWVINLYHDYEVQLAKFSYLKGCQVKSYRCEECEIQIIKEKE